MHCILWGKRGRYIHQILEKRKVPLLLKWKYMWPKQLLPSVTHQLDYWQLQGLHYSVKNVQHEKKVSPVFKEVLSYPGTGRTKTTCLVIGLLTNSSCWGKNRREGNWRKRMRKVGEGECKNKKRRTRKDQVRKQKQEERVEKKAKEQQRKEERKLKIEQKWQESNKPTAQERSKILTSQVSR